MDVYHRWCLPFSFQRCKVMGIRLAMALMSLESDMQNVPVIQRTARFCIFFSSLMFFKVGALLKNQSWNLYKVIGKTQVLYSSLF